MRLYKIHKTLCSQLFCIHR